MHLLTQAWETVYLPASQPVYLTLCWEGEEQEVSIKNCYSWKVVLMTMTKYNVIKSITIKADPGRRILHVAKKKQQQELQRMQTLTERKQNAKNKRRKKRMMNKQNVRWKKNTHTRCKIIVYAHTLARARSCTRTHKSNFQA